MTWYIYLARYGAYMAQEKRSEGNHGSLSRSQQAHPGCKCTNIATPVTNINKRYNHNSIKASQPSIIIHTTASSSPPHGHFFPLPLATVSKLTLPSNFATPPPSNHFCRFLH